MYKQIDFGTLAGSIKKHIWIYILLFSPVVFANVQPMVTGGGIYQAHTVGLKSDGSALAVGGNDYGQTNVSSWNDLIQVSAGSYHTVGVKSDGTVLAVGDNGLGQLNVSTWSNIIQVAAGGYHTVGLKSDNTVVAVGHNAEGQLNIGSWTDIIQVDAATYFTIGLKTNGTAVAAGKIIGGVTPDVSTWTNIIQVAAGQDHVVGLKSDSTVVATGADFSGETNVSSWTDIIQIAASHYFTIGLKSNGTVVSTGRWQEGQRNVGSWTDIIFIAAGAFHSLGLKSDGTVLCAGNNYNGECNVSDWDLLVNTPPQANAGENLSIDSYAIPTTVIHGSATDEDPDDIIQYRWLEGSNILLDWTDVEPNGDAPLYLSSLTLGVGSHTLTLEVSDGIATATDDMLLTISNSAPNVVASGGGSFPYGSTVTLSGEVSDYDGDNLTYEWKEGTTILCSGIVASIVGGDPVVIPDPCILADLSLGDHAISLEVTDSINPVITSDLTVSIFDDQKPTLAPVANKTILWPPSHELVQVMIVANASDNSGLPVSLTATVMSNEPEQGVGDGDLFPDWTVPLIDQNTGIITLQLRAERSGKGKGREYVVHITAADSSGNVSVSDLTIIVPHDKSKN